MVRRANDQRVRKEARTIRLLFDLSPIQPKGFSTFHGASEYAKAVYKRLCEKGAGRTIVGIYDPSRPLDSETLSLCQTSGTSLVPVRSAKELEAVVVRERIDRFYSALPYRYGTVCFGDAEVFCTVHGLRPLELPVDRYLLKYSSSPRELLKQLRHLALVKMFPRLYAQRHLSRFEGLLKACVRKGKVIVPSRHTKYVLLSHFPWVPPDKVLVLWSPHKLPGHGSPIPLDQGRSLLNKYKVSRRKFFLVLSANRWVKNAYRAVKALDSLYSDWPTIDYRTVVLGAEERLAATWGIRNIEKFSFAGYVQPAELEMLYESAYALLYVSLNEGFGYPPVEAMKYGTPAILSGTSAIPEVCGDAALYVDPTSLIEIKSRVLTLLHEPPVWEYYSMAARKRAEYVASEQDRMLNELCDMLLTL